MKLKKILAGLMTCSALLTTVVTPVYAEEIVVNDSTSHNSDVPVSLSVNSTYTVKLPASVALHVVNDSSGEPSYVEGDIDLYAKGIVKKGNYVEFGVNSTADAKTSFEAENYFGTITKNKSLTELKVSKQTLSSSENTTTADLYAYTLFDPGRRLATTWSNYTTHDSDALGTNYGSKVTIKLAGDVPTVAGNYQTNVNITYALYFDN